MNILPTGFSPLAPVTPLRQSAPQAPSAPAAEISAPPPQDGAVLSGRPALTLANGFTLDGGRATDASGRSYPVKVERDEAGQIREYRFACPQGSVRVDATDLTLTMKNPAETVTQTVEASGRHVVQCQSCFRDPATGKLTDLVQSVVVEPDGLVRNLSRREGVEMSSGRLSFRNPMGLKVHFDLPMPVAQPLQGDCAAVAPAAAQAPRAAGFDNGPLLAF